MPEEPRLSIWLSREIAWRLLLSLPLCILKRPGQPEASVKGRSIAPVLRTILKVEVELVRQHLGVRRCFVSHPNLREPSQVFISELTDEMWAFAL